MAERLERKVVSGVAWSLSEKLLTMVIQMAVSIIVARSLSPDDFGVMAILTFFMSVALTIVDSGFSQTLIRKANPTNEEYASVLGFNVVMSLLLYALLVAAAPYVASFYDSSIIEDVAPILFLVLPINSLCVVQTVLFTREFRFALLSKTVFAASLISGIVAIVMAVTGWGIWALVAQRLLMMGIKAVVFWWVRRWRCGVGFSLAALREMLPFSMRLLATDLIAAIYNNVAQLFIGKMHSTNVLGFYSQAQKLKDLPVISTVQAIQGVTYPALSQLADDDDKFDAAYRRIVRLLSYLIFPVMLGLIAIADDMFLLLLGERWMPTVPYFEILALSGMAYPLSVVAYNVLKVRSDGRIIVRLEIVRRVVMTLVLACCIPQGVEAVAWGMSAMAVVDMLLNVVAAGRYTRFGMLSFLQVVLPHLLLAALMFGLLWLLQPYFAGLGLALRLGVDVAVGVAIYVVCSLLLRVSAFGESLALLRGLFSKNLF